MNIRWIVLSVVFILCPLLSAQPPTQNLTNWKSLQMSPEDNPQSSWRYSFGKFCFVWVRRDGTGVSLVAIDPDYVDPYDHQKWPLQETVRILKTNDGVRNTTSYEEVRVLSERGPVKGYDIFDKIYKDKAKDLPFEVRKLFWGTYGIGAPP